MDSVQVSYDVYAFARSVADSFLDDTLAFLSPTGLFLHPAGQLGQPVTVTIEPAKGFARVSTGLEPVAGRPNTFRASDFDELYDCPMLVGNQEVLSFEVRGVPHRVSIVDPGRFDRDKLVQMLKRVVEAAVAVVDDVPYRHYDVYAPTAADIDYTRYLAYAGLEIQLAPRTLAGASLGASTREQEGRLIVSGVTRDSAAARAGLSVDDEILAFGGVRVGAKALADGLRAAAPGDEVRLLVARRDHVREIEVVLDPSLEPSFRIQPVAHPDVLQSQTLDAWLPNVGGGGGHPGQ